MNSPLLIGKTASLVPVSLLPQMANRHGLIAGATGTGKTVTLQVLAEQFSQAGVPVFSADIKGDLSGLLETNPGNEKVSARLQQLGISDYTAAASPVCFWDVYGKTGLPIRTTISEMGPVLLAHLLELNEVQEGILYIAFRVSDDEGLALLDIKDLRSLLEFLSENRTAISSKYGNVTPNSIAALQRKLLVLEEAGGEHFFGEPAFSIQDLIQNDFSGRGVIHLLDATTLVNNPRIYSTFLLWMLSELFEDLPEQGDSALPKMVFFFDEAHLLFASATKPLLEKIEQVVRLVRSKGIGIYFVTQHPDDIPDRVLAQLGNRWLHALRAFTPSERKFVKHAAASFRTNPAFDTEEIITELQVGEALVSILDEKGAPSIVERTLICPPHSKIGVCTPEARKQSVERSPLRAKYAESIDRESAYELLQKRKQLAAQRDAEENEPSSPAPRSSNRQSAFEAFFKSVLRSLGSQVGREFSKRIGRGVLGGILGKK